MTCMKNSLYMAAVYAAFIFSGCVDSPGELHVDTDVYYASVEQFEADTRTSIHEGNRVKWSDDDMIAVFDGKGCGKAYNTESGEGSTVEFFPVEGVYTDGESDVSDVLLAVYPFGESISVISQEGGSVRISGVSFPQEQTYLRNSFAEESFPMVSASASGDRKLSFRNAGGVLKLGIRGIGAVRSITVSVNEGICLSGKADIVMSPGGEPATTMTTDSYSSVSLLCSPAVQLSEASAEYFMISLPPVVMEDGFTVTIENEDGREHVKTTSKRNVIKRSAILSMPVFDVFFNSADDHEAVDLGLSVGWASCNVGAAVPEEYGGYFAWGETAPKSKFIKNEYAYYDADTRSFIDIGSEISGTEYDAATVIWGAPWRMPTKAEIEELIDECVWASSSVNGVNGCKVTGPNGNSIFFPYSGYRSGSSLYFAEDYIEGNNSYIWTGTIGNNVRDAYVLSSSASVGLCMDNYWQRYMGMTIRPVRD